jgi:hypothetical protein
MSDDNARFRNADSRRDFLGKLGAALGGTVLVGGGSGVGRGQGVVPNGYQFHPILVANDNAPYTPFAHNPVAGLTAAVMLGSAVETGKPGYNVIYFHGTTTAAFNPNQPTALFFAVMDYTTAKPQLTFLSVLTYQGATLASIAGVPSNQLPLVVSRLGTGACNSLGHYATTIFSANTGNTVSIKAAPGVYLYDPQAVQWTKVARFGDAVQANGQSAGVYGADFGDVAIDDDDNVTIVAALTGAKPASPSASAVLSAASVQVSSAARRNPAALGFAGVQALVHVPRGRSGLASVLAQTGDMLPGSNAIIRKFGLIDVANDGSFVAQVSASRVDILRAQPGTAFVTGSVRQRRSSGGLEGLRLLAASPHLLTLQQRRNGIEVGECIIGPRIASEHLISFVTHEEALLPGLGALAKQHLALHRGGAGSRIIAETGNLRGRRGVAAFGAPALSTASLSSTSGLSNADSLIYCSEALDDGSTQLFVQNGDDTSSRQVILKSGDILAGGDPPVNWKTTEILYGYHPAQADQFGRVAFAGEFLRNANGSQTDPNNVVSSLLVGIPS